jgi:GTPase SAR1 family protein
MRWQVLLLEAAPPTEDLARRKYKVCLIGDAAVGKTSLIRRFVYNDFDD